MENTNYKNWIENIKWMEKCLENKKAKVSSLQIKPPVSTEEIIKLEKKLGVTYPDDFKKVLTDFAGAVHFS